MSETPGDDRASKQPDGLSRRDVLLGRLLRSRPMTSKSDKAVPGAPPAPQVTMRYPKSLADVEFADQVAESSQPSQLAARRRPIPVFRPPGAIDEPSFLAGCTRCEACLDACPHGAIIHAPPRLREAAGTPMLDADRQPCLMCADFPCIQACEPGVLRSDVPKMMGTARITEHLCLPHHGTPCTTCGDECPVDQAVAMIDGKPVIDETRCTGCGVCRAVCPAPENAILLMPTFLRPPNPRARKATS